MKILVPTAGVAAARETADYVMEVASAIDAEVVALHVVHPGKSFEGGELSLQIFKVAGSDSGVPVQCELREGGVVAEIVDYAEQSGIDLIVMGASNGVVVDCWLSSDVCG